MEVLEALGHSAIEVETAGASSIVASSSEVRSRSGQVVRMSDFSFKNVSGGRVLVTLGGVSYDMSKKRAERFVRKGLVDRLRSLAENYGPSFADTNRA